MATKNSVDNYINGVLGGKFPANRLVRQACERHLHDIENAKELGIYFDLKAANFVVDFFEKFLVHSKGEWAGKPFKLGLWECFILGSIFGWKRVSDGKRRFRVAYTEVARKNGKALALNTPLPTPDGWVEMGDVQIGDKLFDEKGNICNVTGTTEVMLGHDCFKIVFSDGEEIISDADHLWKTISRKTNNGNGGSIKLPKLRKSGNYAIFTLHNKQQHVCRWDDPRKGEKFKRKLNSLLKESPLRKSSTAVRTTLEIKNTLYGGSPAQIEANRIEWNHKIPLALSLKTSEISLPIPPYVLGAWLGDGHSSSAHFSCSDKDGQILDEIKNCGISVKKRVTAEGECGLFLLGSNGRSCGRNKSLQSKLRKIGLLNNKHIPTQYLRASEKQRYELLQGLMDTDGYVSKAGQCEFTSTRKTLAMNVLELLISLGIKARLVTKRAYLYEKDCGEKYRIFFWAHKNTPIFKLKRKTERLKESPKNNPRSKYRQIIAVDPVESVPVRCVQVDSPSNLYLAGASMVPTHNTSLAAGIGLFLFVADGEAGAEVFCAATKREQACLSHSEATRMVKASPFLRNKIGVFKNNLHIEATNSKFEPLGADADTMDGLNVHGVIIDELHAHKNRLMWDVLDTATGARTQPLIFAITTAGSSRETVCWEQHDYAQKILNGTLKDETFFAYIAGMDIAEKEGDAEDDWTSEETWKKANPNFGISVKEDDLRRKCEKAKQSPASQNAFFRLHLNKWVQQVDRWIDINVWNENYTGDIDERRLLGRRCYGGLDLSSVSDMSAWVLVFPDEDKIDILARFWCPEDKLYDTSNKYKEHYQTWHRQGFLETTPGNAIDFAFIRGQIIEDAQKFQLIDMNIDRLFQAHQLAMELVDEGIAVVGMGMGYLSFAAPMKDFERRLLERKLNHGGNPVLRWMADNVAVSQDPAGNLKPNKAESQGKIDGIVSLVMALDRLSRNQAGNTSVYDERGLLTMEDFF